jgi:hypothetical protein
MFCLLVELAFLRLDVFFVFFSIEREIYFPISSLETEAEDLIQKPQVQNPLEFNSFDIIQLFNNYYFY